MAWQGTDPAAWTENTKKRLTALLRNSVQSLAKEASTTIPNGGRVPVKTGYLARSVVISNQPPSILTYGPVNPNALSGAATLEPGDTVYIGWQASYARRQNYGFTGTDALGRRYNQAGYGFAEATAAKWPAIVKAEAAKIAGR